MRKWLVNSLGCILLILVLAAIFFPVTACAKCVRGAPATTELSQLKQQGLGLILYASDHDGRFARRDFWMDDIYPYVKTESIYHSSKVKPGEYGFAFNSNLSTAKAPVEPIPMVYDSVDPVRNASDPVTSLPDPPRWPLGNNVAYSDGHAKRIPKPQ